MGVETSGFGVVEDKPKIKNMTSTSPHVPIMLAASLIGGTMLTIEYFEKQAQQGFIEHINKGGVVECLELEVSTNVKATLQKVGDEILVIFPNDIQLGDISPFLSTHCSKK